MIVWKNSLDYQSVRFPDRAVRWKQLLSYGAVTHRACGEIQVTTYHLPPPENLPAPGKIVFLADLHYRKCPPWQRRLDAIENALEQLKPDLLLLGGDAVADAVDLPDLSELLRALKRHAANAFAIAGNWEQSKYWLSREYWREFFGACGFTWLDNRSAGCGAALIAGVDDLRGDPKLPELPSRGSYNILLAHRPDTVIHLDRNDALQNCDLILCGHLHGGQVRLPFWGAFSGHSFYGKRFDYGLYQRRGSRPEGGPRMIVTSGLGELSFPFRFGCRREIVAIEWNGAGVIRI